MFQYTHARKSKLFKTHAAPRPSPSPFPNTHTDKRNPLKLQKIYVAHFFWARHSDVFWGDSLRFDNPTFTYSANAPELRGNRGPFPPSSPHCAVILRQVTGVSLQRHYPSSSFSSSTSSLSSIHTASCSFRSLAILTDVIISSKL